MYGCIAYIRILTFFSFGYVQGYFKEILAYAVTSEHLCKLTELSFYRTKKDLSTL